MPARPGEEYAGLPQEPLRTRRVEPQREFDSRLLRRHSAVIMSVASDGSQFTVRDEDGGQVEILVPMEGARARVLKLRAGDVVDLETVSDEGDVFLKAVAVQSRKRPRDQVAVALVASAAFWFAVAALAYRRRYAEEVSIEGEGRDIRTRLARLVYPGYGPRALLIGRDGRYSKSQTQMALWFFTLLSTYTAALVLRAYASDWRLWGGIDIPQNLLLISGLSALSFGGAKAITSSKVADGTLVKQPPPSGPRFGRDLLYDDTGRHADLGDFQMLVMTALAVGTYFGAAVTFLRHLDLSAQTVLPDVDTTILGMFGIGQGAYLAKKALESDKAPGELPPPTPTATPAPETPSDPLVEGRAFNVRAKRAIESEKE